MKLTLMRQKLSWHIRFVRLVSSARFFWFIIGVFALQAAWIAFTARYPEAFDEQFHVGITQIYAHQWSPFFIHQPVGADRFSALTADPSFLYHYLLSFPYRLLVHLTSNFAAQIVILRLLNVGLFIWGLVVLRKLLLLTRASKALVHITLLFFIFLPVVPLLAAQVNYDNLLLPPVWLSLLWTWRLVEDWRKNGVLSLSQVLRLLMLCLLSATVQFSFLPILAAIVIVIGVLSWRSTSPLSLMRQFSALSKVAIASYIVLFLLAGTLWAGVYGRNLIDYHTLLPSCPRVLSVERCMAYAPYVRDYQLIHNSQIIKPSWWHALPYSFTWLKQSMSELVFTITSNFESDGVTVDYHTAQPLPVVLVLAWAVLVSGVVLVVGYWKRLWRFDWFRVSVLVTVLYTISLWAQDFLAYHATSQPEAVHGRYLLPILPLILIAIGMGYSWLLHSLPVRKSRLHASSRAWLAVLALLMILQGGGFITYIVRSDNTWFWDQSTKASRVNRAARKVLKHVIVGY